MDVLYPICCGLDVHKASITACLRRVGQRGRVTKETRTVGTTTAELLGLCDWLVGAGCTHVAMESTGVFWKPVFNLFEGHLPCEVALPFGQGGIASVPGDYKVGRSSPLSDAWARSDHQQRWRSPALWAGRVTSTRSWW